MTSKSVGLVLATAMLFAAAPSAFAQTPAPCTTGVGSPTIVDVTQHITNDVDSGFHGNWALDNYDRRLRVWLDTDGSTYCAQADYNGTFHAPAGVLSPGQSGGNLIAGSIDGTMVGGYTKAITGGTPTTSPISIPTVLDYGGTLSNISTWTPASVPAAYNYNTSQNWLDAVFNAGYSANFINGGNGWSWTYISNGTGPLPGWINAGTGSSGDIAPFVDVNTGTGYFSLQSAVDAATAGDTVALSTDATTTAQVTIKKAITLEGNGHTLRPNFTKTDNTNNAAIGIDNISGVTIQNLVEDGTRGTSLHGINVFEATNVTLNNVTLSDNGHSGLVVNGSTVVANNLTASGNGWNSVNVDPGVGETMPSVFTLNSGTLSDPQIFSDGSQVGVAAPTATVTVVAPGYTKYGVSGHSTWQLWTDHTPTGAVIGSTIYSTIAAAVAAAANGDTIHVGPGTYAETVNITKPLTLEGAQAGVAGNSHSSSESSVTGLNISMNGVTVNGFAFTNAGPQVTVSSTTAVMSGVVLENNVFNGYSDVGIPTYDAGNIVIENNTFKNVSGAGEAMQIKADTLPGCTGSQVLNNVFVNATNNNGADVNFSCTGSDSQNVTISGNTSTGNTGGSSFVAFSGVDSGITVSNNTATTDGSSIFFFGNVTGSASITGNTVKNSGGSGVSIHGNHEFTSDGPDTGTFTITGNTLTGNANGVAVSSAALGMGASILIHNNSISGNTSKNINSATSTAIDAANNWWGSASSTVFASSIVGNVNSSPWYLNPERTVLSGATGTVDSSSGDFTVVGSGGTATFPDGVTGLTLGDDGVLDLSGATTTGSGAPVTIGGATVTLAQAVTLQSGVDTEPIVLANMNLSGVTASIPDGTTIQGPTEWDGTIAAPTATSVTGTVPAGFAVGGTAITVGSDKGTLVFDNPVTLTLAGVTGAVGFKPAGSDTWTQITTACAGTYDNPTAPTPPGECFISNGTDTKIVTYHFTTYGGMTIAAPVFTPNGGIFQNSQDVTVDSASGTTVHYTTADSPVSCASTEFTGTITVTHPTTFNAVRCDSLGNSSAVTTVTFSPAVGSSGGGGGGGGGGSILAATPATPTVSPATPATPAQGQVLGAAGYKFTLALATGSKNADVTALQQYLTTNGYYNGPVTGYFGPLTRAAVVAFQKARSIAQTGTVGPLTRAALNENVAETTGSSGTAAAAGAKLTVAQVNAILNVLQSFGADASVIAKVKAALGQ